MPTFEYQVQRADGRIENGTILGASLEAAVGDLTRQGLSVLRIGPAAFLGDPLAGVPVPKEAPRTEAPSVPMGNPYETPRQGEVPSEEDPLLKPRSAFSTQVAGPLVGKVSLANQAFFFRQLSTMLRAGVPFVQSLDTLSGQTRDPKFKGVIRELKTHVEAGRPMSAGMQRYPEVFGPLPISLVRAGETSGNLDEMLSLVAKYLEDEIELRNLYRRVTIYPKIVLVASVVVVLGTNAIIASLGKQGGLTSPLTEPATWVILGPALVFAFLWFRLGLANHGLKQGWDRALLLVPFLGGTLERLAMAKFGRAFGALYRGGLPMGEGLKLSADACGNEALRARMYRAVHSLEQGAPLTETLRETQAFSPIVLDMVKTGETTGNLDQMLDNMANFYEDEGKTRAVQLGQFTGVAVLLMVAIYVGFMIIKFWTGYFGGMADSLKG